MVHIISLFSVFWFVCYFAVAQGGHDIAGMDRALARLGVSVEDTKDHITKILAQKPSELLKQVRSELFEVAKVNGLAHCNDVLVHRLKRATGPRLETKLANDIALLIYNLKNHFIIPRTLLRNGKKSQQYYVSTRNARLPNRYQVNSSIQSTIMKSCSSAVRENHPDNGSPAGAGQCETPVNAQSSETTDGENNTLSTQHHQNDTCFVSETPANVQSSETTDGESHTLSTHHYQNNTCSVSRELQPMNCTCSLSPQHETITVSSDANTNQTSNEITKQLDNLRGQVNQLQLEVNNLYQLPEIQSGCGTCQVYVKIDISPSKTIDKSVLAEILNCTIKGYRIVRRKVPIVCQVTISKSDLHQALTVPQRDKNVHVQLWRPSLPPGNIQSSTTTQVNTECSSLRITTWNCRGLRTGEPYLNRLAEKHSDIVVVTEHWLWPYESHKLANVHDDYNSEVVVDKRLTDCSNLTSGCGGVGILWRKHLDATPISGTQSDRLCAIRIKMRDTYMTIIGVYMPCAGADIQAYGSHLIELERLVTEAQDIGLVCIVGDFNAHIGVSEKNPEGVLIEQWMDRCSLYAASLSPSRNGPMYTYFKCDKRTTVDYIFTDIRSAEYMDSCQTHDHHSLNTSDHLPLSCEFSISHPNASSSGETKAKAKVDWNKAIAYGKCATYQQHIAQALTSIAGTSYSSTNQVNEDIIYVSKSVRDAAISTLPLLKPAKKQKKWYSDETLSNLCKQKKEAWDNWKKAGSPNDGPFYERRNNLREEVRKRLKICRANEERKRIEKLDCKFRNKHPSRFRTFNLSHSGVKVRVAGNTVSDKPAVLQAWCDHFESLAKASTTDDTTKAAKERVSHLLQLTHNNTDLVLEAPFSMEELDAAIKRLKPKKAADLSGITSEHIKYGGYTLKVCLLQLFNAIIKQEMIPESLSTAVINPVYKGGGKDPLERGSYRGISVTPVLAKLLEMLIMARLVQVFEDLNIPHPNQTGYRKHVSCTDAIFTTTEILSHHLRQSETTYLCCYDLQKAYDTVEYSILLCRLYDAGINAKLWRLIRAWYQSPKAMVKVGGELSAQFSLERGVRQGSVLSPLLFQVIMNPLLIQMELDNLGISYGGIYLGAAAHADDIRTITSSKDCLEKQVQAVKNFANRSGLSLNVQKCEILTADKHNYNSTMAMPEIGGREICVRKEVKCLGCWLSWDLSAKKAIEEAIVKSRRAFFMHRSQVFEGNLNPLSGRSLFEVCIVPILLYGCENWQLTPNLIHQLEHFQGEIGRRILKLTRNHSTFSSRIALRWPSVAARILIKKLNYLCRLKSIESSESIASKLYHSSNPFILSLSHECKFLEEQIGIESHTERVISGDFDNQRKALNKEITEQDWKITLEKASKRRSTKIVTAAAYEISWLKVWDMTLDRGARGTARLQSLFKMITWPSIGDSSVCPVCRVEDIDLIPHLLNEHLQIQEQTIINILTSESLDDIMSIAKKAHSFLSPENRGSFCS